VGSTTVRTTRLLFAMGHLALLLSQLNTGLARAAISVAIERIGGDQAPEQ
jgi:hypothetical protein